MACLHLENYYHTREDKTISIIEYNIIISMQPSAPQQLVSDSFINMKGGLVS